MDIIKKMLRDLTQKDTNSVYLREIALLMEEMEELKAKLEVKDKLIKNYQNELQRRK